jgi:hypothetical protein
MKPSSNPEVKKRLYTLKEAATYLGRGLYGIRELVWRGALPIVKNEMKGRKMFVDVRDLGKYIDQNKQVFGQ